MDESRDVDAYLEALSPERRRALGTLRTLVGEKFPDAAESLKYRMPTYEWGGHVVCAFASQKGYMSLYLDTAAVERHLPDLAGLSVGKSCIRFRRPEQLPLDTVQGMLVETLRRIGG